MTLKDTIEAELVKLRADYAATKAEIDAAEGHLANFAPWIQQEAATAKAAIVAFFDKFHL